MGCALAIGGLSGKLLPWGSGCGVLTIFRGAFALSVRGSSAPVRARIKPLQKQPRAASSSPLLNCLRSLRQGAPCVRLRRRRQNERLCGLKSFERCLAAVVRFKKRESPLPWGLTGDFYIKIMLKSV